MTAKLALLIVAASVATVSSIAPTHAGAIDTIVDVHFVYTQEREDAYGGRNQVLANMQQSRGLMNRAHDESNTGMYFNYVFPHKVDYTADSSNNNALYDLRDDRVLHAHRDRNKFGSDVLGLNAAISAAGVAFVGNPGYYVVRYLTGPATAHEVGHTLGCGHGGVDGVGGSGDRPYARGWAFIDTDGTRYGTVMTGANIARFSNPNQTFRGRTIGIAGVADCKRRIRETRIESSRLRKANPAVDHTKRWAVVNRRSGHVMEVGGALTTTGANINIWSAGGTHKEWLFDRASTSGYVKLRNRNSGLFADVSGVSLANGATVHQWTDNGDLGNQDLKMIHGDDGFIRFEFRHSGKVLEGRDDADRGRDVAQWDWVGGTNQQWYLMFLP